MEQSANPNLRRLSAHPKTFQALMHRQNSYFEGERRRSTIRRMSSQFSGKTNESFERDSVISETGQTLSCWISFRLRGAHYHIVCSKYSLELNCAHFAWPKSHKYQYILGISWDISI